MFGTVAQEFGILGRFGKPPKSRKLSALEDVVAVSGLVCDWQKDPTAALTGCEFGRSLRQTEIKYRNMVRSCVCEVIALEHRGNSQQVLKGG